MWQTWANSVDPAQILQNAASDQGLHCLPLIQQFYTAQHSHLPSTEGFLLPKLVLYP